MLNCMEMIRLACSDNFDLGTQSDCHVLGSLMREEVHNQLMAMLQAIGPRVCRTNISLMEDGCLHIHIRRVL